MMRSIMPLGKIIFTTYFCTTTSLQIPLIVYWASINPRIHCMLWYNNLILRQIA